MSRELPASALSHWPATPEGCCAAESEPSCVKHWFPGANWRHSSLLTSLSSCCTRRDRRFGSAKLQSQMLSVQQQIHCFSASISMTGETMSSVISRESDIEPIQSLSSDVLFAPNGKGDLGRPGISRVEGFIMMFNLSTPKLRAYRSEGASPSSVG